MSYLRKIVCFFVVSVFSICNCYSMQSVVESFHDSNEGVGQQRVVPCSELISDVKELRISPSPSQLSDSDEQISVDIPSPFSDSEDSTATNSVSPSPSLSPFELEIVSPKVAICLMPSSIAAKQEITDGASEKRKRSSSAAYPSPVLLGKSVSYVDGSSTARVMTKGRTVHGRHSKRLSADPSVLAELSKTISQEHLVLSVPTSPRSRNIFDERIEAADKISGKIILTIDGGGSRGIIPLQYLVSLRQTLKSPLKFDIIAGTSVGAMIGAAVALDKITDMYDNFQGYVDRIFSRNWWSLGGLLRPIYSSAGRLACINELLEGKSEEDIATKFIAPFYSLLSRETKVYKNFGKDGNEFSLSDVLMMSSAAPTYFNPHNCFSKNGVPYEGVDGGIFANHPGLIAYHEAKQLFPNDKIFMISLGTGTHHSYSDVDQSRNRGLIYWGGYFPDMSIEASSFLSNKFLTELAANDPNFEYIRLQPSLEKSCMITDGTSIEHIRKLETVARMSIGVGGPEHARFQRALEIMDKYVTN